MATPDEIRTFKDRWTWAINSTATINFELPNIVQSLREVSKKFYFSRARQFSFVEKLRYALRPIIGDFSSPEEKAFLRHPLTKRLLEIWLENVYGVEKGVLTAKREEVAFLSEMIRYLQIKHDPAYSKLSENYENTMFGMKILRPNNSAHIYISYNFLVRPMKKFINEYFRWSVITGNYDIVLKRFPPYHNMLNFFAPGGERTMIDSRGLDFPPITYRLDLKFSVPIGLHKIQTRSNERFISCPIVMDEDLERERQAEIKKIEEELSKTPGNYFSNIEIGEDGKIYYLKAGGKEEIQMYGPRRAAYLQQRDLLNLLKSIPRPSAQSGLVIRFNLLNPVTILIEGINRKREITLDEVETAWKCIDILENEYRKEPEDRRKTGDIIDEVFANPKVGGVKEATTAIINEIERLRKEDPTEEEAWRFLIARFNEGKGRTILPTICNRLIGDAFDLVFSLWPLITGNEIKIDPSGKVEVTETPEKKKNLLPLIEFLKREIEALLKNIFTKYLDISAATNRFRSEPVLAGMIVEYCLNIKIHPDTFRKKLENHLKEHYRVHFDFLKEYLKEGSPTVLQNIHKLDKLNANLVDEQIKADIEGIMTLIDNARNRLYSPSLSSRLLCYIDPHSIDVQIGTYQYDGKGLEEEQQFIINYQQRQFELAEILSKNKSEADKIQIERFYTKKKKEGELKVIEFLEGFEKQKGESQTRLNEHKIKEMITETRLQAIHRLKDGNIKDYAILSLIKAHHDGGIEKVEHILEHSPNIVMAIDPHLHHHQEIHEIKQELMKITKENPELIKDPIISAMLLSEDFKDIVAKDIYQKFNEVLTDIVKNYKVGFPILGHLGLPPGAPAPDKDEDKNKDKDQ